MDAFDVGLVGVGFSPAEVEVTHAVHRHDVDVDMGYFEAGDHQANTGRGEQIALCSSDSLSDHHQMGGSVGVEISPMVDLGSGHDENVAGRKWPDVHERNACVVGVNKTTRDLAVDDAGEDGGHKGLVGWSA